MARRPPSWVARPCGAGTIHGHKEDGGTLAAVTLIQMKIVYLVPGSGGTFYCQNCVRDIGVVNALRELGHDVFAVPLYLPPRIGDSLLSTESPVFYGAVGLYLEHRLPLLRRLPRFLRDRLNSPALLELAARRARTTRASGLESLTISMLAGEEGDQADELDRMVQWLASMNDIDVIHFSNCLLLGLANRLKTATGARVVCSLQDEEQWIDHMAEPFRTRTWGAIREKTEVVDAFITVSEFYADQMKQRLDIPDDRMHVVPPGVDPDLFEPSSLPVDPPVIGFLARMCADQGLDLLVEAFIILKRDARLAPVRLHVSGGQTGDDVPFIDSVRDRLEAAGVAGDVLFLDGLGEAERVEFLAKITLMCVPAPRGEAFGLFQLEAMAAGVPVVQPEVGAYPEVIAATGGGITYSPNDATTLADALRSLLTDPDRLRSLGEAGRQAVRSGFTLKQMAEKTAAVYA